MKNSTNKFLLVAVVLLLIINIALVAFMVMEKNKKVPAREGGKAAFEKMVNEMGMDTIQKKEFDGLREAHFSNIRPIFDSIRTTRQALFNLIKEENLNDSLVTDYTNSISEKQIRADKLTINHFRTVRKMFSGDKLEKFDELVQKMLQRGRRDSTSKKEK